MRKPVSALSRAGSALTIAKRLAPPFIRPCRTTEGDSLTATGRSVPNGQPTVVSTLSGRHRSDQPRAATTLSAVLHDNVPTLALGAAALLLTAAIFLFLPPQREATSLAGFLLQLLPFVLAAEAIARLRLAESLRLGLGLVAAPMVFLVIFCWFVPKVF